MISSKQRAWLRSQANQLTCQFQVGKEEITDKLVRGLDEILSTHELLKINVLRSAEQEPQQLAAVLAAAAGAEVVQVIGRHIILYRHSEKLAKVGRDLQFPRNI